MFRLSDRDPLHLDQTPKNNRNRRNTVLDELNAAAESITGEWVKLTRKEHGAVEGVVLTFETRPMAFEGAPVLSRKTGQQRTEWVFAVRTDDGETVKFSLRESGQRAVANAIKEAGGGAKAGDRIKIAVKTDPAKDTEQPEYQARWTPGKAEALGVPTSGGNSGSAPMDEEPFIRDVRPEDL
jgi:hypothetical protein